MKSGNLSSGQKRLNYVADFETTTSPDDCRVWLWGLIPVQENVEFEDMDYGISIDTFADRLNKDNTIVHFHNLAFDGCFILDWLLKNGYRWVESHARPGDFTTLISKTKKFYSIKVKWLEGGSTEFRDSLKKLSMSVSSIAESFDLPMSKLHMDYHDERPIGHEPTQDELDYLFSDVAIVSVALFQQFNMGMKKLTVGSDSLHEFKQLFGVKAFERSFPVLALDIDKDVRGAYRGGWTYCDDRFSREMQGAGMVYDVNSLYPSIMYNCVLPWDYPVWFTGAPKKTDEYPLYVVSITFTAKLRDDHLPVIQVKSHPVFASTEYIREIEDPVTMMVTNVDLELWEEQYEIDILSYNGGWKFKGHVGFFKKYIDKWSEIKNNSTGGKRLIAKLHLNSLYGKFATNPDVTSKVPYLSDEGVLSFKDNLKELRNPVYTAMGVFVTAYGRAITVRAAQANYDTFAYADTDSIHLLTTDKPNGISVDNSLGNWKLEYEFDYAIFWRAKVYMERATVVPAKTRGEGVPEHHWAEGARVLDKPEYVTHVAGMPESVQRHLTFSDFEDGRSFPGKLLPKHVSGGIVLLDVSYTLR